MPKIGVEFKKRYVIETDNETEAIEKAEEMLDRDFGDNEGSFTRIFEVVVIPTESLDPNYTLTHRGERVLWVLLEDDAQEMAKRKIGRRLTEDELYRVKKGLEGGMRYDVELETAVEMAVEGN